jgi:SAM-dependent methyltransferase
MRLVLAEPDAAMRQRLGRAAGTLRLASNGGEVRVELSDAAAGALPFSDGEFDAVVSTLVLCSVADPPRALEEIHRVLKPGGRLVFIEHVAAQDGSSRLRWQRRLEPLWKRVMGNCHLTRDTEAAIRAAGFALGEVQRESLRKAMPIVRPSIRGVATR